MRMYTYSTRLITRNSQHDSSQHGMRSHFPFCLSFAFRTWVRAGAQDRPARRPGRPAGLAGWQANDCICLVYWAARLAWLACPGPPKLTKIKNVKVSKMAATAAIFDTLTFLIFDMISA